MNSDKNFGNGNTSKT